MATVTHTIYSHYDPKDREKLQRETAQLEDKTEAEESWKTEPPKYRNQTSVPRFVAATVAYDSCGFSQPSSSRQKTEEKKEGLESDIVNWYRSLRRDLTNEGTTTQRPLSVPAATLRPKTSSRRTRTTTGVAEMRDKNNWFIMNAMNTIKSEPSSTSATPKPPPTLADILARDPPPKPNERMYIPPVWLEIGPSNKGFAMLQKSGWNEGEALGPDIVRRKKKIEDMGSDLFGDGHARDKGQSQPKMPMHSDVNRERHEDVIDLTLSDSDSVQGSDGEREAEGDDGDVADDAVSITPVVKPEFDGRKLNDRDVPRSVYSTTSELPDIEDDQAYRRRALLTPLATVLKSDRLGIGLKAKRMGPYKASRKRVTHNAEALAAHIRTAEELRKKKKELGRGRRGFERLYRKEASNRQMMLAYMNS